MMRKLRITLASLLAAAVVVAPAVYFFVERANEHPSDVDLRRMQGEWNLQDIDHGDRDGLLQGLLGHSRAYIDVKGSRLTRYSYFGEGFPDQRGEFTLDATNEPKHLDIQFEFEGVITSEMALYRLEHGTLSLCRNRKDPKQRPAEFRADRQTGIVIETYERGISWRVPNPKGWGS